MAKSFVGGIHPKDSKALTAGKPIERMPIPEKVIIPVRQHIGAPCTPIVQKGDAVKKGQVIADTDSFVSSPVHATISGTVSDIGDYPHAVFGKCLSIVITSDGQDEWLAGIPSARDWESLSNEELIKLVRQAGIVGMGGATFPTHVKLQVPADKKIEIFILNAAECEPYLTADHRLMLENPAEIISGMKIIMKLLGAEKAFIGIEDNKPDAIESMATACVGTGITVAALPTKYPQGAEKMLIKAIAGREVPSGKLPLDVGVVVQNVGTAIAISQAVTQGIPLIERVTTVSGKAVKSPKNVLVRIGTTFEDVIEFCGGFVKQPEKIVMGGPMMGFAQSDLKVSVIKGVSGILALSKAEVNSDREYPCIRCGRCVEACPMGLTPAMFGVLGQKGLHEEARDTYSLLDCAECGSCVFVCPSKRNLVQYVRYCKQKNAQQPKKK